MSEASPQGCCDGCGVPIGSSLQAFALQHHTIEYALEGESPDEQAYLTLAGMDIKARFCSSACCKPQLPALLLAHGLPAAMAHNKLQGGPLHPCGKCGKPVNMTQPHGAYVRCKLTPPDEAPDWFDVLALVCVGCAMLTDAQHNERAHQRSLASARQ